MVSYNRIPKLLKQFNQARTWLAEKIVVFRATTKQYRTKIDEWSYAHDLTRRKLRRLTKIGFFLLFVAYTLAILFIGISLVSAHTALVVVQAILRALTQAVNRLAVFMNLSNPSEFTTILVAEVIAIFGSSIIARIFSREPKQIVPHLLLTRGAETKGEDGVRHLKMKVSNKTGETAALECEATITFVDVERRDVLDHGGAK